MNKEVPKILVELWINLARSVKEDHTVRERALSMLRLKVGNAEEVNKYMKANNIR